MPSADENAILREIVDKHEDYESRMSEKISSVGSADEIFLIRKPPRDQNTFSNPRVTEMYRSAKTLGTLYYRMMTAQERYIDVLPMQAGASYDQVETILETLLVQDRVSNYKANLLKACIFGTLYGTVFVQQNYTWVGVNALGRRIPVTTFYPRTLDQVGFDISTLDIRQASWMTTVDLVHKSAIKKMIQEAKLLGKAWDKQALAEAFNDDSASTENVYIKERMARAGFYESDQKANRREIIFYNGKIDHIGDGLEYVAAVINRKYLVRFHANRFQHGLRNMRVAKWHDHNTPLGEGHYSLFGNLHRSMDGNRQKLQDLATFKSYAMMEKVEGDVNEDDLDVRPLQLVGVRKTGSLKPIMTEPGSEGASVRLSEILMNEFRVATGAFDSLQAIPSDVSATAAALAQTEGMRNASVTAEMMAEPLVREAHEVAHANNATGLDKEFNIIKAGIARTVYPSDFKLDVDIMLKVLTDKDAGANELKSILDLMQIIMSTKSQHPDKFSVNILPLAKRAAHLLGANPEEIIQSPQAPAPGNQLNGLPFGQQANTVPPELLQGGGGEFLDTPVGPAPIGP